MTRRISSSTLIIRYMMVFDRSSRQRMGILIVMKRLVVVMVTLFLGLILRMALLQISEAGEAGEAGEATIINYNREFLASNCFLN